MGAVWEAPASQEFMVLMGLMLLFSVLSFPLHDLRIAGAEHAEGCCIHATEDSGSGLGFFELG